MGAVGSESIAPGLTGIMVRTLAHRRDSRVLELSVFMGPVKTNTCSSIVSDGWSAVHSGQRVNAATYNGVADSITFDSFVNRYSSMFNHLKGVANVNYSFFPILQQYFALNESTLSAYQSGCDHVSLYSILEHGPVYT